MPSTPLPTAHRAARLADEIRDSVAAWLSRDIKEPLTTVTFVTLSSDMRAATVWLRAFPAEKTDTAVAIAERRRGDYQHQLAGHLCRRTSPSLRFRADRSAEAEEEMEKLLR